MDSKDRIEEHLSSATDLEAFLKYKAIHHNNYKWYSNQSFVDSVLTGKAIYLSDGSNWNDTTDSQTFNSFPGKRRFGLCFSYAKSESVAMWMLYGGNAARGAMIDYPRKLINYFLKIESVELGKYEKNVGFVALQKMKRPDFSIEVIDVLYIAEQDNGYYTIMKSGSSLEDVDDEIVDTFSGVKKSYPWNYETECRLIVEIDEAAISQTALDASQVRIEFAGMENLLAGRVYHAPNYNPSSDGYVYSRSTLKGEINWDLCSGCEYKE